MDKKDIKHFRTFLKTHGVNTMFVGFYRQYRYGDNPAEVEEYLNNVPRNLAISYAFDVSKIAPASAYGANYWHDLNEKWHQFLDKTDERKSFELSALEEKARLVEERKARKEKEKQEKAKREEEKARKAEALMQNDWSGLDLVSVNSKASKVVPMPSNNEIRISVGEHKNVIILNKDIVYKIEHGELDSMDMRVDRNTNRLVLVFGRHLKYNVNKYSTGIKCVQNKKLIPYFSKYLEMEFENDKHYYIHIDKSLWNIARTEFAVILSQNVTIKE